MEKKLKEILGKNSFFVNLTSATPHPVHIAYPKGTENISHIYLTTDPSILIIKYIGKKEYKEIYVDKNIKITIQIYSFYNSEGIRATGTINEIIQLLEYNIVKEGIEEGYSYLLESSKRKI